MYSAKSRTEKRVNPARAGKDRQYGAKETEAVIAPAAELRVFGEEPTAADVAVWVRTRAWRLRGTMARLAGTAVAAPIAFLLPPHAPWGVGALVGGLLIARRRWTERYTVVSFSGTCPRCGRPMKLAEGSRLMVPHALPCEGCHHEALLHLGLGDLDEDHQTEHRA